MFSYQTIDEYQIEITSRCNAACPQCPRNINGEGVNPYMPLTNIERNIIDRAFPAELVKRLRQVFFCGSYGDPIAHPDFLEILQDFRSKNPTVWLYIHTNAGIRNTNWWTNVAKVLNGYGKIDFGFDGMYDTNHIYRKNVNFQRALDNAQAFINAGGKAQWNFIVFKHNEHQIREARSLSETMGFESFLPRSTGRFFNHETVEEMSSWPGGLEPPTNVAFRNKSMLKLVELKKEYQNIKDYFNTTEIKCDALAGKKVIISAEGLVLPCNFFTHNLYDARFKDGSLPGANPLSFVNGKNQVESIIEQYGKENLNIHYKTLEEIFANPFWEHVVNSWSKSLDDGRIFECAMTCGTKLTKVWDQNK